MPAGGNECFFPVNLTIYDYFLEFLYPALTFSSFYFSPTRSSLHFPPRPKFLATTRDKLYRSYLPPVSLWPGWMVAAPHRIPTPMSVTRKIQFWRQQILLVNTILPLPGRLASTPTIAPFPPLFFFKLMLTQLCSSWFFPTNLNSQVMFLSGFLRVSAFWCGSSPSPISSPHPPPMLSVLFCIFSFLTASLE